MYAKLKRKKVCKCDISNTSTNAWSDLCGDCQKKALRCQTRFAISNGKIETNRHYSTIFLPYIANDIFPSNRVKMSLKRFIDIMEMYCNGYGERFNQILIKRIRNRLIWTMSSYNIKYKNTLIIYRRWPADSYLFIRRIARKKTNLLSIIPNEILYHLSLFIDAYR